jgi:hypothetical protein
MSLYFWANFLQLNTSSNVHRQYEEVPRLFSDFFSPSTYLGMKEQSKGPLNSDMIRIAIISSEILHTILKNIFLIRLKKTTTR